MPFGSALHNGDFDDDDGDDDDDDDTTKRGAFPDTRPLIMRASLEKLSLYL